MAKPIIKKTVKEVLRGDQTIKTKVRVDFGNAIYKTNPEIEKIKKIIKVKDVKKNS